MPLDLPVIPDATVLRSATTTSVTPRWLSAHAAAAPSMPPPTMTTSAVVIVGAFCSLRKRSSARNPVRSGQRHPGHCRGLYRHGDEVLGFEVQHVRLAAGAGDGLGFHGEHPKVVGQSPAALDWVEARGEFGILRADARRIGAVLEVVEETGRAAQLLVLGGVSRMVVAQRDECGGADRDGVGAQRQRLGHVGAGADAARDDQLHSLLSRRPSALLAGGTPTARPGPMHAEFSE